MTAPDDVKALLKTECPHVTEPDFQVLWRDVEAYRQQRGFDDATMIVLLGMVASLYIKGAR
jgi:hypothetical protein